MSGFAFDLVTPDRLLVSRPVTMVTVPGEEGDCVRWLVMRRWYPVSVPAPSPFMMTER